MEPHVTWIVILRSSIPPVGFNSIDYGWQGSTVTLFQNEEEIPKNAFGDRSHVPKIPGE